MSTSSTPAHPAVLTSWKDIARYLGKGVRTVQRWEQEFGLPVRRPLGSVRNAVLARPSDLDAWIALRFAPRKFVQGSTVLPTPRMAEDPPAGAVLDATPEPSPEPRNGYRAMGSEMHAALDPFEAPEFLSSVEHFPDPGGPDALADLEGPMFELKQRLSATHDYLQSMVEMQEAANQRLQSANEDLRLDNQDLRRRNELLTQANNELVALLNNLGAASNGNRHEKIVQGTMVAVVDRSPMEVGKAAGSARKSHPKARNRSQI